MTDPGVHVEHMKWWGWGKEGIAFDVDRRTMLVNLARERMELDLTCDPVHVADLGSFDIPPPVVDSSLIEALVGVVGQWAVHSDDRSRVIHAYGKSLRDLLRIRAGSFTRVPDVVVDPADAGEVQSILDLLDHFDCVVVPFGGGSSISGSLESKPTESRPIVSLDLGRMSHVLEIDEVSRLARIEGGVLGPHLEEQLNAKGWTLGHFTDSFAHSSLGGWIATRSVGMQSDKYGDIADMVKGLHLARPGAPVHLKAFPSASNGPSLKDFIIGSEGRLGVITEASMQVHPLPPAKKTIGVMFPDFASGVDCVREIAHAESQLVMARVSDPNETLFSLSVQRDSTGTLLAQKYLGIEFKRRGWVKSKACMGLLAAEGSQRDVSTRLKRALKIVKRYGGFSLGRAPGDAYQRKKFDIPYMRDFLIDRGGVADVSDTATTWANIPKLYRETTTAIERAFEQIGCPGFVFCHLSHGYHAGACLYFTFVFNHRESPNAIAMYDVVKRAAENAFVRNGGTLSHHHAVGVEHSPWLEDDLSAGGVLLLGRLLQAGDPKDNLNPGKFIHSGPPGKSILSTPADAASNTQ